MICKLLFNPFRWVPTQDPSCWWNRPGACAGLGVRSQASSPCIRPAPLSCSQPTAFSSPSAMPAPWRWTGGRATLGLSWWTNGVNWGFPESSVDYISHHGKKRAWKTRSSYGERSWNLSKLQRKTLNAPPLKKEWRRAVYAVHIFQQWPVSTDHM